MSDTWLAHPVVTTEQWTAMIQNNVTAVERRFLCFFFPADFTATIEKKIVNG